MLFYNNFNNIHLMVLYNKELDFQGNGAERFPLPTGSSACAGLPVPLSQPPQSTREHYLLPTLRGALSSAACTSGPISNTDNVTSFL